jgi:hypothetical protein
MRRKNAYNATALHALNTAEVELSLASWQFDGETLIIEPRRNIAHRSTVTASGCGRILRGARLPLALAKPANC